MSQAKVAEPNAFNIVISLLNAGRITLEEAKVLITLDTDLIVKFEHSIFFEAAES